MIKLVLSNREVHMHRCHGFHNFIFICVLRTKQILCVFFVVLNDQIEWITLIFMKMIFHNMMLLK